MAGNPFFVQTSTRRHKSPPLSGVHQWVPNWPTSIYSTWSLNDPLRMVGSFPKIKNSWTLLLRVRRRLQVVLFFTCPKDNSGIYPGVFLFVCREARKKLFGLPLPWKPALFASRVSLFRFFPRGDLEMGATARDLRERMPMRNVVLTIEQKAGSPGAPWGTGRRDLGVSPRGSPKMVGFLLVSLEQSTQTGPKQGTLKKDIPIRSQSLASQGEGNISIGPPEVPLYLFFWGGRVTLLK